MSNVDPAYALAIPPPRVDIRHSTFDILRVPELPDVQVYREYLDATALHQRITRTVVTDEDLLESVSAAADGCDSISA